MSLYFDYKVQCPDPSAINFNIAWHPQQLFLAVASYSQSRGGYVTLYDELGEILQDLGDSPNHAAQVTALQWHPSKKILVTGWENGELRAWMGDRSLSVVQSPHQAPVTIVEWSSQGGRLVTGDTTGCVVGWKVDQQGQFKTVFHLELKGAMLSVVFRTSQSRQSGVDINGLAKAAVNGDESALDMFSAWRPRTAGNRFLYQSGKSDNLSFYAVAMMGAVYHVTEEGKCMGVLHSEGGSLLRKIAYRDTKEQLLLMTESLRITHYQTQQDGSLVELTQFKLTGHAKDSSMVSAGPSLVAITTGDLSILFWNLDTGENDVIRTEPLAESPEHFTCLAYSSAKGLLCGGTNAGSVFMWRRDSAGGGAWLAEAPSQLRSAVKQMRWAPSAALLAVNVMSAVSIMKEQVPCAHYDRAVCAVQVSPRQLDVEVVSRISGTRHKLDLKTDQQVTGVCVSAQHVAVWSTKTIVVYKLDVEETGSGAKVTAKVIGSFPCTVEAAAIDDVNLVVLEQSAVNVRNFQGAVKQTLDFTSDEGSPMSCELCGPYLTVATTGGFLKVWELSGREAKLHCPAKDLKLVLNDFSEVISAKANSDGTKVSFNVADLDFVPGSKLYLWNLEDDALSYLDVETGTLDSGDVCQDVKDDFHVCDRFVLSHYWDSEEPRLLACEAKLLPTVAKQTKDVANLLRKGSSATVTIGSTLDSNHKAQVLVIGLFTSAERVFIVQDVFPLSSETESRLLGVQTPHYLVLCKPARVAGGGGAVERHVMRDFQGLEECDPATRKAVVEFSYSMSGGHMDKAFAAIKSVQNVAVWESLARMCVKTRRLDVAAVCLGHMRHVSGIQALRAAEREPEIEARAAMLAIQLGMLDDAERLYVACKRYDLLNRLYQARGQWDKAVELAESLDRVHLRATYHACGRHWEREGDAERATRMYEKADTHRAQVPRMLYDSPELLEEYVSKNQHQPELVKWWGQYMESNGQLESAADLYRKSSDYQSLVRVLCFQDKMAEAAEIANATGHKAACYHLARQYEGLDMVPEAVHFFAKAEAFGNAVRLCRDQGLDEQLWKMALQADQHQQLEAAKYFEQHDKPNRAVVLYHKSGNVRKAVDLALRSEQYDALHSLADALGRCSDPDLVRRCAAFFSGDGHHDRAAGLLARAGLHSEAVAACEEHNVTVTDELAEQMTPDKGDSSRRDILERIAELCQSQGNYHLATKKYTEAGDKTRAMKALLRSGDSDKITFFASVSRQRDIYVMAANHLQSLDWQRRPDVLKTIVAFYTKGRAPDLLANFYAACAQLEVDEFRNYEKALGALEEAQRCLGKEGRFAPALERLDARVSLVRRFVDIRRQWARGDRDAAFGQCRQLLQHPADQLEQAVRRGDVYTLMVEHRLDKKDYEATYALMEEFQKAVPNVDVCRYLGAALVDRVVKEMNLPLEKVRKHFGRPEAGDADQGEDEEIQEEIQEEN